jgi:hypothetical protein
MMHGAECDGNSILNEGEVSWWCVMTADVDETDVLVNYAKSK